MPTYSVAQAKDQFSKLIDETLAGEEVTITRHGKPVVELRAKTQRVNGPIPKDVLKEIERISKRLPAADEPASDIIRRMRDEEDDL